MLMKLKRFFYVVFSLSFSYSVFAFDLRHGEVHVQAGGFVSNQGTEQNINIIDLIGNQYTVHNHNHSNGLFGIGYFIPGLERDQFNLLYGINGFYMGNTSVSGTIVQEHLFTNLAYNYKIQNTPLYAAVKANIKSNSELYNVILDAGIGPNFMRTSEYSETPLDIFTIPDNAFRGQNQTTFSATAGISIRLNQFLGKAPVEFGYRFYYLGRGQLQINNSQIVNTLTTGDVYANAIMCAVVI